jgi:hypothetical protein
LQPYVLHLHGHSSNNTVYNLVNGTKSNNTEQDALQTTRQIRQWEHEIPTNYDDSYIEYNAVTIVVITPLRQFIGNPDMSMIADAGADLFLYLPPTNYTTSDNRDDVITLPGGTTITKESKELATQTMKFDQLARTIIDFKTEVHIGLNVTVSTTVALSSEELAALPGSTVGDSMIFEGTIEDINNAMKGLYYYGLGVNGNINLTILVIDNPLDCQDTGTFVPVNPRNFVQRPYYPFLPATDVYGSFGNNSVITLCDRNQSRSASATLPLIVIPVNQAPFITLESDTFTSQLELDTPVPLITLNDDDHLERLLQDSLGLEVQPSVTLELSAIYGVLTFHIRDGVVFTKGKGREDRNIILRGALDKVNNVLSYLNYACTVQYGCTGGISDVLTITVDDEGYVGHGGPLTATSTIAITVTSHQ